MGEQLWRGQLRGPLTTQLQSKSNQYSGLTTIASGSASQVVSTSTINSGQIVLYGVASDTRQNSGFANAVEVCSITDGGSFVFAWADADNLPPRDTIVMWTILKGV